jgi:hypothetical protein
VRAAEPFTKLQTDVIGCVISEERARQRAELKAALDELRAELRAELRDAKARGDETVKTLRTEMARVKAYDDGSLIDITPASSVIRKTKDNNAA